MSNFVIFVIKSMVVCITFGIATTVCCTPMVPIVGWCEKKQFAAKGSHAYWGWAWACIAALAATLIGGIVLSIAAMQTNLMQNVMEAITVGIKSLC